MSYTVRVTQWETPIKVSMGQTILEAAIAAGQPFPHGCRSGNCAACKCRLISGDVELSPHSEYALTPSERAEGLILACRAVAWDDSEIELIDADELIVHPSRELTCRVEELVPATHDIMIVRLRIGAGGPFDFSPGQYALVRFAGQPAREYSMANQPGDDLLEFHIRRVSGGQASGYAHDQLKPGDTVGVSGPLGTAYFRAGHRGPIVAVAGGSGLAPVKSIVDAALAADPDRPILLYFGVRAERDLYLVETFEALARSHPNFRFVLVLSEAASGETSRRTGFVTDALASDLGELDGAKIYVAGPPPMVEAATTLLTSRGVRRADIHADAFYTASEKAA